MSQIITISGTEVDIGITVEPGPISLTDPQTPGIELSHFATGDTQHEVDGGIALSQVFSLAGTSHEEEPAAKIVQITYDLNRLSGANAAVNDGPDNWTNPNNATGKRDAINATRAGQALAATNGNLRLGYANFTDKTTLTIMSVQLLFSTQQAGTVLNNGGLHHEYRLVSGGAWTSLQVFTGNVNFIGGAATAYDITAAVGGDWALLDALEVRVRAVLGVGTNLVTCSCDAVEVEVLATETEVL